MRSLCGLLSNLVSGDLICIEKKHIPRLELISNTCLILKLAAADLRKCFPKLNIKTVSSNKLLGLFGQELSMPTIGFPYTSKTLDMHDDPIVIIVSHSGGTFSPLACSNLLQSFSRSIFAITSEW